MKPREMWLTDNVTLRQREDERGQLVVPGGKQSKHVQKAHVQHASAYTSEGGLFHFLNKVLLVFGTFITEL